MVLGCVTQGCDHVESAVEPATSRTQGLTAGQESVAQVRGHGSVHDAELMATAEGRSRVAPLLWFRGRRAADQAAFLPRRKMPFLALRREPVYEYWYLWYL